MNAQNNLVNFFITYILITLLFLVYPQTIQAATIAVNTTADEFNVNGNCSLREAIQSANMDTAIDACAPGTGADTIVVPSGTYILSINGTGEDANVSGDLDITNDLIINGAGATTTIIDGDNLDRVFHIKSSTNVITVEINGTTIRNGFVNGFSYNGNGGGISNDSYASLTLNNTIVSGNSSVGNGGGIFNNDFASLTLNNSIVSGNLATVNNGGGIYNSFASLTLNNSIVSGNSTGAGNAGGGGGILNDGGGLLNLNDSTVSANSALLGGGGGILNQNGGIINLNRSTITGNSAASSRGGGGIHISGGGKITVNNSTISNNTTTGEGGGIHILQHAFPGLLTLSSSTIVGNSAIGGGGGIRDDFDATVLKNTIIANNTVGGDCLGIITSAGYNLIANTDGCTIAGDTTGNIIGSDPILGPLADNGGPTQTHAVLAGSPVIDAGSSDCPPPSTDQRGVARPQGISCDIGAFELGSENYLPIANAGPNQTITSEEQISTIIQGTATDPDSDPLTYRWLEGQTELLISTPVGTNGEADLNLSNLPVSLAVGTHTLTLEVGDGKAIAKDDMLLTIDNSAPHAAPTGGGTYQISTSITVGGQVSDFDNDPLTYSWHEGATQYFAASVQAPANSLPGTPITLPDCALPSLGLGVHILTLTVSDGINPPMSSDITVTVIDSTAPTLAPEPDKSILWPPNHQMVNITIDTQASDNGGPLTLSAVVASNEPQNGLGDGDTAPDWIGPVIDQETGEITLQLRAERSGSGDSRVYTIAITATDASGNSSTADVEIIVPHDKGKK